MFGRMQKGCSFAVLCFVVLLLCGGVTATLRPPAIPLAVSTPFFSIWSFSNNLATQTNHWHGEPTTLESFIRIDNKTYVLMGVSSVGSNCFQPLPQVFALTTRYNFTCDGLVDVVLSFTTPALPGNYEASSRGGTYISWQVSSHDGLDHNVQLLFDASGEAVKGGYPNEMLEWDRPDLSSNVTSMRIGLTGQKTNDFNLSAHMKASTEPHQLQDFGFVYVLTSDTRATSLISSVGQVQSIFSSYGLLQGSDLSPPSLANATGENVIVSAVAISLGIVTATVPASARVLLFCDEIVSVLSYETFLPPLWRKSYPIGDTSVVPSVALLSALSEGDSLIEQADAFDSAVAKALESSSTVDFASVAQLTFRQVSGANGVTWNGSSIWTYQKEISSDGDMSTLDVIFPSMAQHLYFDNASGLLSLLDPLLFIMADFNEDHQFKQPCSFHSAGKWPVVDVGDGGCSMPMESTGDVLLLASAVTMARGGDASWAAPYMPTLGRFAQFCIDALPFPSPQDMTDDFSHAPGNLTNLALKCILGIGGQAYQEQSAGNTSGAAALYSIAKDFGEGFAALAPSSSHPGFKFIYNDTWNDSYGLMYNAYWARLLGIESLIPNFYQSFNAHYNFLQTVNVNATWCIPLSSIEHDSKWDWLAYTAALMYTNSTPPTPSAYSMFVFDQITTFVNTTGGRFPLSDHPECTGNFPPQAAADRARPVLGAFFAPLLISNPPENFIKERAAIANFLKERKLI